VKGFDLFRLDEKEVRVPHSNDQIGHNRVIKEAMMAEIMPHKVVEVYGMGCASGRQGGHMRPPHDLPTGVQALYNAHCE
jgi:hypothetical protein